MHLPQRPWYFKKDEEIRAANFSVEARDCTALGYVRVNKDGTPYGVSIKTEPVEVKSTPKEEPALEDMTRAELIELAGELNLKVKSNASKAEVLKACEEAING